MKKIEMIFIALILIGFGSFLYYLGLKEGNAQETYKQYVKNNKDYNYALIHTDGTVDSLVDAKEDGICGGFIVLYQLHHPWRRIQIGSEYKWVVPAK